MLSTLSRWKENVNLGAQQLLSPRVPVAPPPFGRVLGLVLYISVTLLNYGFFPVPQGIQGWSGLGTENSLRLQTGCSEQTLLRSVPSRLMRA